MDRRDDRRDDRAAGRAAKQACKAGDEKSRAECRQEKRTTKHGGGADTANRHPRRTRRNDGASGGDVRPARCPARKSKSSCSSAPSTRGDVCSTHAGPHRDSLLRLVGALLAEQDD